MGNVKARQRVEYLRGLLDEIGLDGRRVQMVNMSAAMGAHFAMAATEMTEQVRELGPNPLKEHAETRSSESVGKAEVNP